uniref:Uncharacterized protein n=1 Tax=Trichinella nativa TaxID=6335 RepID=A0A0V1KFC2_9BILA
MSSICRWRVFMTLILPELYCLSFLSHWIAGA